MESPDGKFRLTAVGAQTKGFTETKTFVGGYESVKTGNDLGRNLQDLAFTGYKFYYLSRDLEAGQTVHVVPNSVIIDYDLAGTTNLVPSAAAATTRQGDRLNLVRLTQGTDYLVDSATGLITFLDSSAFRPQAASNIVVAFKVEPNGGGAITSYGYNPAGTDISLASAGLESDKDGGLSTASNGYHMIQYGSRYGAAQYDAHMSCQFYNLGDRDILPPGSDPDFKLNVYGPNQTLIYPLNVSGYTNYVNFDLQGGWMRGSRCPIPFAKSVSSQQDMTMDPGLQERPDPLELGPKRRLRPGEPGQQFHHAHRVQAQAGQLQPALQHHPRLRGHHHPGRGAVGPHGPRPGLFPGLHLRHPGRQQPGRGEGYLHRWWPPTSTPRWGGQYTSTVWGGRVEYDLTKDISLGSAFLWNSADPAPGHAGRQLGALFPCRSWTATCQATVPQDLLDSLTRAGAVPAPAQRGDQGEGQRRGRAFLVQPQHLQPQQRERRGHGGQL